MSLLTFMLFLGTYLFQVGLVSELAGEFRWYIRIIPTYFIITVLYAVVKIVRVRTNQTDMTSNAYSFDSMSMYNTT